jgi:hypothetical protein
MDTVLTRPNLTMPEQEAAALRAAYASADVILEYGSGGSTVMASEMPGKSITSVESDGDWAAMMQRWFEENPPVSSVAIHHVNIGPTKAWGMPKGNAAFQRWPDYPLNVWGLPGFRHPDVVLIDGRFRPACLLATALHISHPVTAFVDDYTPRAAYHKVEAVLKPVALHGRMAEFRVEPMQVQADRLLWLMRFFLKPL